MQTRYPMLSVLIKDIIIINHSIFNSAVPSGSGAFQIPTCPSSSASTLRVFKEGKGQSQKCLVLINYPKLDLIGSL